MVCAAAGDNQRIEVKTMDKMVYSQVLITCTTINVISIISMHREKWELFKSYNRRDVEVEMSIQKRLANYPVPDFVWDGSPG